MAGYWEATPKGTWTIVDAMDAIECLKDPETRAKIDLKNRRINAVGPIGKAVIIDLKTILANFTVEEQINYITQIESITGEKFSII